MKKCYWILGLLAVALTSCSGGGDGDGGNDYINPNKGVNNTTDFAVTGGVQATGMTYADLTGYVNIPDDYQKSAATNNLVFRVGVYYGESESSLTKVEYGSRSGRTFTVTLKGLQAGKTYYYKSFLDWGNSGYGWEYWDNLGTATEVGSFTTKPAAFNGTMTTGKPSDITFFTASISASVDVSSLNAKETYIKGLIYSQNQSALSSQLAQKLSQAAKESTSGGVIEITGDGYYGGYVNGDLHFNISDENQLSLSMEPGNTVYYCPFIIISDKSFTGEVGQVTLRDLKTREGFIDLGLSCLWSATNLDATSPWDMGNTIREDRALTKIKEQYGTEAHVPSQEEVEELNRCSIEEIDNGVLITGPNGNQIFLPTTPRTSGTSMYDNYRYMTSSGESKTTGSGKYSYQRIYNILYQYNWNSKAFETYKGTIPYYDSSTYGSNKYNYQSAYFRAVKPGGSGTGTDGGVDLNTIAGTYTTMEYQYYGDEETWYHMTPDYEMTITTNSYNPTSVEIYNLWRGGKYITGELNTQTGEITIPSGQNIYDHSTYGNVWVEPYSDKIIFTYDAATRTYSSNIMSPVCSAGRFRYFEVEMVHQ